MKFTGAVEYGAHPPVVAHVEVAAPGAGCVKIRAVAGRVTVGDGSIAAGSNASVDDLGKTAAWSDPAMPSVERMNPVAHYGPSLDFVAAGENSVRFSEPPPLVSRIRL